MAEGGYDMQLDKDMGGKVYRRGSRNHDGKNAHEHKIKSPQTSYEAVTLSTFILSTTSEPPHRSPALTAGPRSPVNPTTQEDSHHMPTAKRLGATQQGGSDMWRNKQKARNEACYASQSAPWGITRP